MGAVMIELSELRDAAQKAFPADKLMPERDAAWQLCAEMGWLMLEVPEELGGLGLGREAAATIHYEMGRVLSTAPLIPALLGLRAVCAADGLADKAGWVERLCGGEYAPLHLLPARVEGNADQGFSGTISGVCEADMASHVVAGLPGCYALIPLDAAGVIVVERPAWDKSRRLFDVQLADYRPDPALVLASGDAARALHDALSPHAQLALAADSLGGAEAALAVTVEYLKMRRQFDRPLAMFQALKHRCADLKTLVVANEALLWSRARDEAASVTDLGATKAQAADVYRIVTEEMIQLHGGIGLTEEYNCHLFMKRAMLNLQLCGSLDHWREAAGRQALARLAG